MQAPLQISPPVGLVSRGARLCAFPDGKHALLDEPAVAPAVSGLKGQKGDIRDCPARTRNWRPY
jgi:hypothetical protein